MATFFIAGYFLSAALRNLRQHLPLLCLHPPVVRGRQHMVIADKMQHAVHQKGGHFLVQAHPAFVGLPLRGFKRDCDVAQQLRLHARECGVMHGKRNDIGRAGFFQVLFIEPRDACVIQQKNAYLGL